MSALAFIGAVFLWSVLNISECDRQSERIIRSTAPGMPENMHSKLPETLFVFRRSNGSNLQLLLKSRRSGNNPVPPTSRLCALPLTQTTVIPGEYIPDYNVNAEQFVFQNYQSRSIPQRAGPFVS